MPIADALPVEPEHYTTAEVARMLGMAVRSVQLMVDRGELQAWKTPGGHRRITHASVASWRQRNGAGPAMAPVAPAVVARNVPGPGMLPPDAAMAPQDALRMLLIEDSVHFQNLVRLLVSRNFPSIELHVADNGITGMALYGQVQPDILLVDILLPDIDGATLVTTLRSHPQFARSKLLVITSLDVEERGAYAFALAGVPVIHKPQLVQELPQALQALLAEHLPA